MRAKKQAMNFYPVTVASAVHMDGTDKNLKDDYSEFKSEIEQARTATTGEKFGTIDERLNTEIGRLKKGFTDVNLIEQDSKESHSIQNTCEGSITDLIIKGRTLNNLIMNGKGEFVIDKSVDPNNRIYKFNIPYKIQRGKKYAGYIKINNIENSTQSTSHGLRLYAVGNINDGGAYYNIGNKAGIYKFIWNTGTAPENIAEFHTVGIFLDSDEYDNNGKATFSDFMLFEGGTDLAYIDEYIQGIESSAQKEGEISILSHGKNLIKEIERGNLNSNTGENTPGGTELLFRTKGYVNIKPSSNYIISCNLDINSGLIGFFYDENKKMIKAFSTLSAIAPNNAKYLRFRARKSDNTNLTDLEFNSLKIQLEEGTIVTPYEPYKEDKKDILLPQYGFDEGLRGLNNYIYDELNYIRNVAVKRIEKYIVTGNEKFTIDLRNEYMYCYIILERCKPGSGYESICNQFNYIDALWDKDKVENQGKEGFDFSGGNILSFQLPISKLEAPTNEGVKKYFKTLFDEGNPVIVYYELAEPIETPLKESIELTSYNDATYVLFENKIGGTSSFKLPVDISKTINSLILERNILENKVSTVSNEINQIKTRMIQILSNKE